MRSLVCNTLRALALFLCAEANANAESVEDFYRGKTIAIIVGYDPGGGYDLYGRLIAGHLGKYVPGHPAVVVQNMPGAGGIRAANFMYSAAAKDGTVLGLVTQTVALEKVLRTPLVQYDAERFNWIGRAESDDDVFVTWHTSKVKTIDDALKNVALVPGPSSGIFMPGVMNNILGARLKIVHGYMGSSDSLVNMERGEVDGASASWSALKTTKADWLEHGTVNLVVQFSPVRKPDLQTVPDMVEVGRTAEQKEILALYANGASVGKSIFAPPETPVDRVEALRAAFDKMVLDVDFLSEARRMSLAVEPVSGVELQQRISEISHVSADVLEQALAARGQ
jgi:tripartite-type tricarboxylate transporter receptor subunit TctC